MKEGIVISKKESSRIGEIARNKNNSLMKIIKYNNALDIDIEFENGFTTNTTYYYFKKGSVFNPLDKVNYNIGYFGIGKYNTNHESYHKWIDMLKRCYDQKYLSKFETYKDCTVCDEWHNFQVFAKWYDENYYKIENERMELDKDILVKGNKIYSPDTCVFVPQEINYLFIKVNKSRGKYPIGVYLHSDKDKYVAQCNNINKKAKYLGRHNTVIEAFNTYKNYKESVIKQVADKYKDKIPQKLYDAMYVYKVEITD